VLLIGILLGYCGQKCRASRKGLKTSSRSRRSGRSIEEQESQVVGKCFSFNFSFGSWIQYCQSILPHCICCRRKPRSQTKKKAEKVPQDKTLENVEKAFDSDLFEYDSSFENVDNENEEKNEAGKDGINSYVNENYRKPSIDSEENIYEPFVPAMTAPSLPPHFSPHDLPPSVPPPRLPERVASGPMNIMSRLRAFLNFNWIGRQRAPEVEEHEMFEKRAGRIYNEKGWDWKKKKLDIRVIRPQPSV
jgi:hypothetical protein